MEWIWQISLGLFGFKGGLYTLCHSGRLNIVQWFSDGIGATYPLIFTEKLFFCNKCAITIKHSFIDSFILCSGQRNNTIAFAPSSGILVSNKYRRTVHSFRHYSALPPSFNVKLGYSWSRSVTNPSSGVHCKVIYALLVYHTGQQWNLLFLTCCRAKLH